MDLELTREDYEGLLETSKLQWANAARAKEANEVLIEHAEKMLERYPEKEKEQILNPAVP